MRLPRWLRSTPRWTPPPSGCGRFGWATHGRLSAARSSTLLRRWAETHPDVPLQLKRVDDRLAGLGEGLVDVALLRHQPDLTGLDSVWVRAEARVAALPATHPLVQQATLTLSDLSSETLALNVVSGTTSLDLWALQDRPTRTVRTSNTDDWLAVIAAEEAVGITTTATAELQPFPGVTYRPISDAPPLHVWLAWPTTLAHPFAAALVDLVQQLTNNHQSTTNA
ncbi:LysR family substrate-binding domain-containing protein [Jannaschia sp. R86511]|uniref:LysR family substrate-binding domain-containing protein n=1 Tax=Jannaschia sp. R86511 TaxID=3093853 RepID=UPI0036D290CA